MFYWRTTIASDGDSCAVDLGFTGRSAGRGSGPYAGLNLGGHVGDDAADVEGNRTALAHEIDVPRERLVLMNQVHGADVAQVDGPWVAEPPAVDGIVTRATDLALAVLVADCVPVLLHDAARRGRRGGPRGSTGDARRHRRTGRRSDARPRRLGGLGDRRAVRLRPVLRGPGGDGTQRCRRSPRQLRRGRGPVPPPSTWQPGSSSSSQRPTLPCSGFRGAPARAVTSTPTVGTAAPVALRVSSRCGRQSHEPYARRATTGPAVNELGEGLATVRDAHRARMRRSRPRSRRHHPRRRHEVLPGVRRPAASRPRRRALRREPRPGGRREVP